ncbi:tRNA pseudouridine synthase 1 [Entophlyctis luteolus]|nr:tRNA pseudouridine synthase 1 [Entophlyctis luteolus]KAJ3381090.1 tRNA pseudouridine synthase 1 [Entophlyctis sp. JEL0112]
MKLAILFAYNGTGFAGLERAKGDKAVESILLAAVAAVLGAAATAPKLAMLNISRAATTEDAEHGARQVVSLEVSADAAALAGLRPPTPEQLNALLPEAIKVFSVLCPEDSFSARRSCETRTYEYLIPTYAFMPPQPEAGYDIAAESLSKEDLDNMYPDADPQVDRSGEGSLFTTLRRLGSRSRSRSRGRDINRLSIPPPLPADQSPLTPLTSSPTADRHRQTFFSNIALSLGRRTSAKTRGTSDQPIASDTVSTASLLPMGVGSAESSADDDGVPQFFDPINLPHRGVDMLRAYRMTEEQLDMVRNIIAIYRGTHNWHNYVPGGDPDDQRCYMRIINIESGPPELHNGMEWIRIKVQAKALARFQLRRMIGLLILVIRTNTPRSVIANSFGASCKFEIPDAPASSLVFHQPQYAPGLAVTVALESERAHIEAFRKSMIHERVYQDERVEMVFEEWLRGIDQVSFLYKHFLNSRGIVTQQTSFLRDSHSTLSEEAIYNVR